MKSDIDQSGFGALAVILIISVLLTVGFAGTGLFIYQSNGNNLSSVIPFISNESSKLVTIQEINQNKEMYVGVRVKVYGKIFIDSNQYKGEAPCDLKNLSSNSSSQCVNKIDPIVYLSVPGSYAPGDIDSPIELYKDGKPWPCTYTSYEDIDCGKFKQDLELDVEGDYIKISTPYQLQDGGNSYAPDKEVRYTYKYYLDVD